MHRGAAEERRPGPGAAVLHVLASLDYVLIAAVAGLVGLGLWIVSTVTRDDVRGDPSFFTTRQGLAVGVGTVALVSLAMINPEVLRRLRWPIYAAAVASLVIVLFASPVRGTNRWIELGFFNLQPSEFTKVAMAIFFAGALATGLRGSPEGKRTLYALALATPPIVLIFVEPDFGSTFVIGVALLAAIFFAGARWLTIGFLLAVATAVAVTLLWVLPSNDVQLLKPYQIDRLVGFLEPDLDPSGTTYNVNQSITAVGAGGLTGRGSDGASQTTSLFLPEHATDFVFSSFAEQRGFVGALALLLLYAVVVWRGIRIIAIAPSRFTAVLAGTLVAAFLFQVVVNLGMTMGIAPVVGLPLPFISYGGSSMVATLAAIGILLSIHARGKMAGR
ncbi:MAG: FtsW/RodA/SpoVE family cell cycle protein [Gaiellales bacterium]